MKSISERLEGLILKEEAYEITVPRNISQKIAPALTSIRNVTVSKSFDLKDLERHRFMVSSMMDADVIETQLRDRIKKLNIRPEEIKIAPATQKSLDEGILEEE